MNYLLVVAAAVINVGLFIAMERTISGTGDSRPETVDAQAIEFVKTTLPSETRKKDRARKAPPKPSEVKQPEARIENQLEAQVAKLPLPIESLALSGLAEGGSGPMLGSHLVQGDPTAQSHSTLMMEQLTPISTLPPEYPMRALVKKIEGHVDIGFIVDRQGFVSEVNVVDSSPRGLFEDAARHAALRWRFQPYMHDGRAVSVYVETRVSFRL